MREESLSWIEDDDYAINTVHTVSKKFAIKTLKALYDEWPGGLEEVQSAFRTQAETHGKQLNAAHQIIRKLTAQIKELVQKK